MSNLTKKYHFYMSVLRRTLLICGLWPGTKSTLFHRLFPYVNIVCVFLMVVALLKFCYDHKNNLEILLKGFGVALSYISIFQKVTCFVYYRKQLAELHNSLATLFDEDFENNELRPVLLSPLLLFSQSSFVLMIFLISASSLFTCKPIIMIIIQLVKGNDVKYSLPMPTSYPWKFDASGFSFFMHYTFETYVNTIITVISIGVDVLFGYYVFQISGQLRTLSYRMIKLSSKQDYRKVINECVNRHKILARCQANIELIYGPIVLVLSISNAIVICSLLYQAAHMPIKQIIHVVIYMVYKAIQILLYGWFGTRLTVENEMFRDAIYASDWPGSGEKCLMSNVLIMMTFSKPVVLRACAISTISVEIFVAVCNTAISYYLMLRTLEEAHQA